MPLPSDSELVAAAEREPAKVGVLAAGAIVGGFALGGALMEARRRGWMEDVRDPDPTPAEAWGEWIAAHVGLVLAGGALTESMAELGRDEFLKTLAWCTGGVFALRIVVDAVRSRRQA